MEGLETYETDKTSAQCEFRINVVDDGDPLMSCPQNIVLSANAYEEEENGQDTTGLGLG